MLHGSHEVSIRVSSVFSIMKMFLLLLACLSLSNAQLENNYLAEIPGQPGVDFPTLASVPDTDFACDNRLELFFIKKYSMVIVYSI